MALASVAVRDRNPLPERFSKLHTPLRVHNRRTPKVFSQGLGALDSQIGESVTEQPRITALSLQDLLDVNALCAGSIAGITTSAAAVAPYGAAVHAACRYNALTKNPTAQATCGGTVSTGISFQVMLRFKVRQVWTRIMCCSAGKTELVSIHRG